MCGVCIIASTKPIPSQFINAAFEKIAHRGPDACGAAYFSEGQWFYDKRIGSIHNSENHEALVGLADDLKPTAALLHTRWATHGRGDELVNAHPVFGDFSMLIHNGVVHVPHRYGSDGETDSEQLLRHIEAFGLRQGIATATGTFAIGMVDFNSPQQITVVKSTGVPLHAVVAPNVVMYCSCSFRLGKAESYEVESQTAWYINLENGVPVVQKAKDVSFGRGYATRLCARSQYKVETT